MLSLSVVGNKFAPQIDIQEILVAIVAILSADAL